VFSPSEYSLLGVKSRILWNWSALADEFRTFLLGKGFEPAVSVAEAEFACSGRFSTVAIVHLPDLCYNIAT
jgi:hypothetical protein